jgi:2,3-bisphosphoglycerate-dependent phosphoglycerate mutase
MPTLALVRHGQSQWNLDNRFTGWVDVDLTPAGEAEAKKAGQLLAATGIAFDRAFTSVQTRAIRTLWLALAEMGAAWLPIEKDWRLNERHYGALTGLNKAETAAKHGDEMVHVWRRSYDTPPPPLDEGAEIDPVRDRRYAGLDPKSLPRTESLKTTLDRVLPYWESAIRPALERGENVVISAHGNSLRALMKHLFGVADTDIADFEFPTGNPLLIDLGPDLKVRSARYLDEARAKTLPEIA